MAIILKKINRNRDRDQYRDQYRDRDGTIGLRVDLFCSIQLNYLKLLAPSLQLE